MKNEKRVFLIGGSPTAGKSTSAKEISRITGLPWISTDQIREVMRSATNIKSNPDLFAPIGYNTAEKFLNHFSSEDIVRMELAQAKATWPGINQFIRDSYAWSDGCIIEGVAITPGLVSEYCGGIDLKSVFLVDENRERAKDVVFKRGLWSSASDYSDKVKPKEVEWLLLFAKTIKEEADKYGASCLDVEKSQADIKRVIKEFNL